MMIPQEANMMWNIGGRYEMPAETRWNMKSNNQKKAPLFY